VGSLEAEFELLGADFGDRGDRADDALRALRASFGNRRPSYEGTHYRYAGMLVEPCGVARPVPLWVGGRTRRSLRRALELGDGWVPFGLSADDLGVMLGAPGVAEELARRAGGFDVVLPAEPVLDPVGAPDVAARCVDRYAEIGATALNLRFRHRSRQHYLEQLAAMAEVAAANDVRRPRP